ncbi:phage tail protein [Pedobacter sp. ASV28]|uniref:phage tail protein n=1 Tax=Pedobacter sp. ASV28 TaxID=2795123 RepID=UPI0018EE12C6|nr:phage tail protein [Pedobacter sp. ASV28]
MANTTAWELPVSFYFSVKIGNEEFAFKEVSGLSAQVETESISEGGVNNFTHLLPKQIKHANLVLKRALVPLSSTGVKWIQRILEGDFVLLISTKTITIQLLNDQGTAIYNWSCENAYPIKWQVETLDSEKNVILIETMEFAYSQLRRL